MKTLKTILSLLLVGIFLAACSSSPAEVKKETPLFTDEDILNAVPAYAETTDVDVATLDVSGGNLSAMPDEISTSSGELEAQQGLPANCLTGIVTYLNQPAGIGNAPYHIRQHNMATGADVLVLASAFPIQSVAGEASGNIVVFTMDDPQATGYNLYLLNQAALTVQRLTNAVGDELNASITRLALNGTITWDAPNAAGFRKIHYRKYIGLPALGAPVLYQRRIQNALPINDSQSSVDDNGDFIGFVRTDAFSRVMGHNTVSLGVNVLVNSPLANPVSHPSPEQFGNAMAYMRTAAAAEQVRIWPGNAVESSTPLNLMNHAHMRALGDCLVVSRLNPVTNQWRVFATAVDGVNGSHQVVSPPFDSWAAFWRTF
jgi:hypothetical protein